MKSLSIITLAFAFGLSTQAALVRFHLSPAGTDVAVGLSPSNQVPQALNSTGSGGEISGGITFDTDTSILHLAVGYGSAAGFQNLTGPAKAMHIHGPAGPGTNASVLVSLVPYNFPSSNPTNGGVVVGNIAWPTNDTDALLSGLTYLNVHTDQYPGGEIRGQLVAVNEAPVLVCPPDQVVECGKSSTLNALFTDPEGDALSVLWTVNGTPVATNTIPARDPGLPAMDTLTQTLALGTNVVGVVVMDTAGNTVSCYSQVVVADTTAPVITAAAASPCVLWPPNHQMVNVTLNAVVKDTCGSTTWKIIRVTSSEPVNGKGDGNTSPDWIITGDHKLKLRAERSGNGHGRVYTICLQATDASGNVSAKKTVTVTVPHNR